MTNDDFPAGDEPFEAGPPEDEPVDEPYELSKQEREDIGADLVDLESMRGVFQTQSVKGVVIACQDCGQNHFYEWELLRDNLEQMLATGEPRMHEPAWNIDETEYIQWDYGKGYVDALADTGLELDKQIETHALPVVRDAVRRRHPVLPAMRPFARGGPALHGAAGARHRRARGSSPARPGRFRPLLSRRSPRVERRRPRGYPRARHVLRRGRLPPHRVRARVARDPRRLDGRAVPDPPRAGSGKIMATRDPVGRDDPPPVHRPRRDRRFRRPRRPRGSVVRRGLDLDSRSCSCC